MQRAKILINKSITSAYVDTKRVFISLTVLFYENNIIIMIYYVI